MGDRVYMQLFCLKKNRKIFEGMGFQEDTYQFHPIAGVLRMVDEEANYGHYTELEGVAAKGGVPFIAQHECGCEYGPTEFACDGSRKMLTMEHSYASGVVVVTIDRKTGRVPDDVLAYAKRYLALYARTVKKLGYDPLGPYDGG